MQERLEVRKKLISKTYLRKVNKYELYIYYDNEDYYISVKKIIKIEKPFILDDGLCLIDNGYYIVEVIPKNENYSMRVFVNREKEILEYYFDISLKNGIDEETNIPYYIDLYLDITINKKGKIKVLDEDELKESLDKNEITREEFDLANKTKEILLENIKNRNNKYMNLDIKQYITM